MTPQSTQLPVAFGRARPPMRTMGEICTVLRLDQASVSARLAVHAKLGRPVPASFRPNGKGLSYYNPAEFKRWIDSSN